MAIGNQGIGPFRTQIYYSCKQTEPPHFQNSKRMQRDSDGTTVASADCVGYCSATALGNLTA
jgi:hypothetical protein